MTSIAVDVEPKCCRKRRRARDCRRAWNN